jgi:HK97 gp10 family phage protein
MNIKVVINKAALEQIDKYCNDLVRDMADKVVEKAIDKCPVKTGTLRDSIRILDKDWENHEITVGTKMEVVQPYAVFVEYGTSKQKAQPFLVPSKDEVVETYNGIK